MLAFDTKTKTGHRLLHSWPKFAEPKAKAETDLKYGQTYLCISLDLDTIGCDCSANDQSSRACKLTPCGTANLDSKSPNFVLYKSFNPVNLRRAL